MVLTQFPQKSAVIIIDQIIETDTRTDEYFLHIWKLPQFPEQFQIIGMIHF